MFVKILLLSLLNFFANGEWVKIPQVSNTPKVNYKIQTVASFSDLPQTSVLAHSDVLSSIFSYDKIKVSHPTTDATMFIEPTEYFQKETYLQSTVTSKSVNFQPDISDRVDREELDLQPVKLVTAKDFRRKVVFLNQTIPMKTVPSLNVTGKKMTMNYEPEDNDDEIDDEDDNEDDGVTILDEDENITLSEEIESGEIYYEYDEEPVTPSTTKAPRKIPTRKTHPKNPQRRVMQALNKGPKFLNSLNFSSFFKFLKNIQNSFTSRTAKNINDKIQMLREFRDNLLLTINQRIKSLWKTQSKTKKKSRSKRTAGGTGGGGWMEQGGAMDFPSAEGALLSISFLTFAVFLIKLVLV